MSAPVSEVIIVCGYCKRLFRRAAPTSERYCSRRHRKLAHRRRRLMRKRSA